MERNWSEMYQRGYEDASIRFGYIPDFRSESERLDYNRGLKDGYAKIDKTTTKELTSGVPRYSKSAMVNG